MLLDARSMAYKVAILLAMQDYCYVPSAPVNSIINVELVHVSWLSYAFSFMLAMAKKEASRGR